MMLNITRQIFRAYCLQIPTLLILACLSTQVYSFELVKVSSKATEPDALNLEALRGNVVYVDFWASWCAPCKKSFPWLNSMQKKYAEKGLKIIGVNVDKDPGLAENFLKKTPADFSMVFDPDGQLASKYKIIGMPSSYLIDRDGNIQHTHVGFRTSKIDTYEKSIQELLEK